MVKGGWHCGAVHYEADGLLPTVYKCYCQFCCKISGGAFQAVFGASGFRVTAGADAVVKFNVTPTYDRHHCSKCHTFLYGQVTVAPGILPYVAVGSLDEGAPGEAPTEHLFVRSKVAWHEIGEGGTRHASYPTMG